MSEEDLNVHAETMEASFTPPRVRLSKAPKPASEYILFRAIGNDLPPRHALGQSYTNVKFIIENEPAHEGLGKGWVGKLDIDQ